jgi:hypothetical protein
VGLVGFLGLSHKEEVESTLSLVGKSSRSIYRGGKPCSTAGCSVIDDLTISPVSPSSSPAAAPSPGR